MKFYVPKEVVEYVNMAFEKETAFKEGFKDFFDKHKP